MVAVPRVNGGAAENNSNLAPLIAVSTVLGAICLAMATYIAWLWRRKLSSKDDRQVPSLLEAERKRHRDINVDLRVQIHKLKIQLNEAEQGRNDLREEVRGMRRQIAVASSSTFPTSGKLLTPMAKTSFLAEAAERLHGPATPIESPRTPLGKKAALGEGGGFDVVPL